MRLEEEKARWSRDIIGATRYCRAIDQSRDYQTRSDLDKVIVRLTKKDAGSFEPAVWIDESRNRHRPRMTTLAAIP